MRTIRHTSLAAVMLAALAVCGCGSSTPAGSASAPEVKPPELADAKGVVQAFLEAFKAGNDGAAEKLLTKKAIEETKKFDLVINVPGDASASFKVLDAEAVGSEDEQGAHVLTQWTDGEGDSQRTEECIIVLRPQGPDWRIAGLIYRPYADLPPVVLDFEDPKDMIEQMSLVEQEATRRAKAESTAETAATTAEPAAQDDPFGARPQNRDNPPRTATRPEKSGPGNTLPGNPK